jgi:uncharacterized metal-binding protein
MFERLKTVLALDSSAIEIGTLLIILLFYSKIFLFFFFEGGGCYKIFKLSFKFSSFKFPRITYFSLKERKCCSFCCTALHVGTLTTAREVIELHVNLFVRLFVS